MEYRKLGLADLRISRIGFGCWAIGGHGYGKVDDRESIKAIQRALDLGINFFDTADVYGFGHSEEILSNALGSQKNNVIIATKFGLSWDEDGKIYKNCSPKRILEALEGSLRRLKMDCIPLYQIHWYDDITPISEIMETLKKCQEKGKIRYIGCSNFSLELILEAYKTRRIESLQVLYNIIKRNYEEDIIQCSEALQMGILVYGVLERGLFSGKYDFDTRFGDRDTRNKDENFQGESLRKNLQLVNEIKKISLSYNKTPAEVAIRWVLDNSNITCAITGIKNPKQIEDNVGALDWKLSKEDFDYITKEADKIIESRDSESNFNSNSYNS